MYLPDLSPYKYKGHHEFKNTVSIGWLEWGPAQPEGDIPGIVVKKLAYILEHDQDTNRYRGYHGCGFCRVRQVFYQTQTARHLLGMSEIWIPGKDGKIFVSPSMIIHYITYHAYRPPRVYIEAVEEFDLHSGWDAHAEFKKVRNEYFGM